MKRLEDLYPQLLGHVTTIEATYLTCRNAIELGIPGDFVEAGVYAGAQSAAMARAIEDAWVAKTGLNSPYGSWPSDIRRVHLFDSFAGFPELSEHDGDMARGGWKAGDTACSLDDCKANMRRWKIPDELLVWHHGLFSETMPWFAQTKSHADHRIAVLRLDADLYESTYTAMRYLHPLVSPGGFVIVDDWNLDGCRKAIDQFVVPAPVYWRKT